MEPLKRPPPPPISKRFAASVYGYIYLYVYVGMKCNVKDFSSFYLTNEPSRGELHDKNITTVLVCTWKTKILHLNSALFICKTQKKEGRAFRNIGKNIYIYIPTVKSALLLLFYVFFSLCIYFLNICFVLFCFFVSTQGRIQDFFKEGVVSKIKAKFPGPKEWGRRRGRVMFE